MELRSRWLFFGSDDAPSVTRVNCAERVVSSIDYACWSFAGSLHDAISDIWISRGRGAYDCVFGIWGRVNGGVKNRVDPITRLLAIDMRLAWTRDMDRRYRDLRC
jgi:hypothetical protein